MPLPALEEFTLLLGRYRLRRPVPEATGTPVWEADDLVSRARVWLAVVEDPKDEEAAAERRRRIRALRWPWFSQNAQLLLGSGEEEGLSFVVVELVDGQTVQERLGRQGRLAPGEAARIAADVADAVQALHDVGLAHGEVDPAHVAITGRGRVKLLDLPVRALAGSGPADEAERREDVRALGSLLYRMLTGAPPAERAGQDALAETPRGLARLCAQALADDPRDRPPSAAAFASIARLDASAPASADGWVLDLDGRSVRGPDLVIALDGEPPAVGPAAAPVALPAPAVPETGGRERPHPLAAPPRRGRMPASLLGVAGLLVVAGVVALLVAGRDAAAPVPRAVRSSASSASPAPAASGSAVPDVTGMTVDEARRVLLDANLVLAAVTPAPGTPGRVLRSDPAAGSAVPADGEVSLTVGVPAGRLKATPAT